MLVFFLIKTKPVSKSGNTEGALTMMGEKKTLYSSGCWQSCLLPRLKSGSGRWLLEHSECLGIRGDTLPVELAIDRLWSRCWIINIISGENPTLLVYAGIFCWVGDGIGTRWTVSTKPGRFFRFNSILDRKSILARKARWKGFAERFLGCELEYRSLTT